MLDNSKSEVPVSHQFQGADNVTASIIGPPTFKWRMTLGDITFSHRSEYSSWKAFWLRFMGWRVEKLKQQDEVK